MQHAQGQHVLQFQISSITEQQRRQLALNFPSLQFESVDDGTIRIVSKEQLQIAPIVRFLEDEGIDVSEARKIVPTLEDVFVSVTGIELAAMKSEQEKRAGEKRRQ